MEQLDIEGETVGASGFDNRATNVETECFETTLRVPKWQTGGDTNKKIEDAASLLAPPRLTNPNQAPVQRARPKCDVDLTVGNWFVQFRCLNQRRGKIRIGKQTDRLLRRQ